MHYVTVSLFELKRLTHHCTKLHYRTSIFNYRHSSSRSYPSRKYPTIWLDICQHDWVTPLSHAERLEALVYGYIRELCSGILPDVISIACLKYTGDVTVASTTELGLNCCGHATIWGVCRSKVKTSSVTCCEGFGRNVENCCYFCAESLATCCDNVCRYCLINSFLYLSKFAVDMAICKKS